MITGRYAINITRTRRSGSEALATAAADFHKNIISTNASYSVRKALVPYMSESIQHRLLVEQTY